jgi:hypothetical protein
MRVIRNWVFDCSRRSAPLACWRSRGVIEIRQAVVEAEVGLGRPDELDLADFLAVGDPVVDVVAEEEGLVEAARAKSRQRSPRRAPAWR